MASRALTTKAFGGLKCYKPLRTMSTAPKAAASSPNADAPQNIPMRQQPQDRQMGRYAPGFIQPGGIFDLWSPVSSSRSMKQMMETMNRLLDFGVPSSTPDIARGRNPWDIVEKDDSYHLRIDVPGFDKSDVKIHVEDDELVIGAEHKGDDDIFGVQRSLNTRMLLPPEAVKDKVKAELKNGVLTITVPKDKDARQKNQVEISVE